MTEQQKYMTEKMGKLHPITITEAPKGSIYVYSKNIKAKVELCYIVSPNGETKLLSQIIFTKW